MQIVIGFDAAYPSPRGIPCCEETMFVAVYWWRAKPGKEEQFRKAWCRGTKRITAKFGSCGSRLHREADGRFIGYAEWPDEAAWQRAVDAGFNYDDEETRALFHDAVAEMPEHGRPLLRLTVTDDLLIRQDS